MRCRPRTCPSMRRSRLRLRSLMSASTATALRPACSCESAPAIAWPAPPGSFGAAASCAAPASRLSRSSTASRVPSAPRTSRTPYDSCAFVPAMPLPPWMSVGRISPKPRVPPQSLRYSNLMNYSGELHSSQPEAVRHHAHGTECHCRTGQNGTQQQPERRIEHTCGNRNSYHVIDERPEQILLHRAHRSTRELHRLCGCTQVATHEHYI